jgi:hypothetical protein
VLTQAAVLKVTAAGTTTSPVKRGAFVLERILGIVPSPPPPDAGAIEPDVRGATTVREQLDKHRRNDTCKACHAKMDGYGFALESFDVTGEWRDHYRAVGGTGPDNQRPDRQRALHRVPYRPGSRLRRHPGGRQALRDVDALRTLLVADPERLARAFTNQLITYATGAPDVLRRPRRGRCHPGQGEGAASTACAPCCTRSSRATSSVPSECCGLTRRTRTAPCTHSPRNPQPALDRRTMLKAAGVAARRCPSSTP